LGFTKGKVEARLEEHRKGQGARLLQVINDAGIGWWLVRTWMGDRKPERRLKKWKKSPRLCPVCNESIRAAFP
jgi:predicted GIY-YIG superfamily endonuclease